jgi:F-type H+-transporting ATPase subunit b
MTPRRILSATLVFVATSPIVLWAQDEHEAEAGGNPLFDINLGLSTWTLLVFLGLVFILGRYAWAPILGAVEAREKGIQGALDEAAERKKEAANLLDEHRAQLADARRQASEIMAQGKTAGEKLRKEVEERARGEGDAIIQRAREEIERAKEAALSELRTQSVELALAAAAKLMQEKIDPERDRELVTGYLDDLASRQGPGTSV